MTGVSQARAILDDLLNLAFPSCCPLCGVPSSPRQPACGSCLRQTDLLRAQPACPTCAASPGPYLSSDGRCGQCRNFRHKIHFQGTIRVAPYVAQTRMLLHQFKFKGAEYLQARLADLMCRSWAESAQRPAVEAWVPVPTHWLRKLAGGFYAAEALARQVASRTHLPCVPLVKRHRLDPHQMNLPYHARYANVKGAFAIDSTVRLDGAHVGVVDDVMTSGATLNEVAKVLKQAGAASVWNLVLARAGRQDAGIIA